jgi:hypothetical protein
MHTLATSQIPEVLAAAQAILPQTRDENLAHRTAALSGYFALSRVYTDRNYDAILAKTLADLQEALRSHRESLTVSCFPSSRQTQGQ